MQHSRSTLSITVTWRLTNYGPCEKSGDAHSFTKCLSIIASDTTKSGSCNRDWMGSQAKNIYYLAFYKNELLNPALISRGTRRHTSNSTLQSFDTFVEHIAGILRIHTFVSHEEKKPQNRSKHKNKTLFGIKCSLIKLFFFLLTDTIRWV